jgi:predicted acyltransferase
MKVILRFFISLVVYLAFPCIAFLAAYIVTDWIFRNRLIPYPFEACGVLAGFGAFFVVLGIGWFVMGLIKKKWWTPATPGKSGEIENK